MKFNIWSKELSGLLTSRSIEDVTLACALINDPECIQNWIFAWAGLKEKYCLPSSQLGIKNSVAVLHAICYRVRGPRAYPTNEQIETYFKILYDEHTNNQRQSYSAAGAV